MTSHERATYYNDNWFMPLLKVFVYGWLTVNAVLFFFEEILALEATHSGAIVWTEIYSTFSATMDTVGWVILLYVMELETNLIPDHKLTKKVEQGLQLLRALCYIAIVVAWAGYIETWMDWQNLQALPLADYCALVAGGLDGQSLSYVVMFDDYAALDATNCQLLTSNAAVINKELSLIGNPDVMDTGVMLALTDVINASGWLLVVAILELELRLQNSGNADWSRSKLIIASKGVIYTVLFACLAYWIYAGEFLDWSDSALWLFAFFFIELNVLDWATEIREDEQGAASAA